MTKEFVIINKENFRIKDDPAQSKIMLGIMESFYSDKEIKDWIKNGKIRKFER